MDDLYLTDQGDVTRDASGDIAMVDSQWRCDAQAAYIRAMTDVGDYLLYPNLGANLSSLYGMPQAKATGDYGISLLNSSLTREGYFNLAQIAISAVPTSVVNIRFDIFIASASQQQLKLVVNQNLGLVS